jgi:DNA-binding CsgD family transcriptional regulator
VLVPPERREHCRQTAAPARRFVRFKVPEGCALAEKELRAVSAIAKGMTYKEMADRFGVTTSTVHSQLSAAYKRLGVVNAAQAVLACLRAGWLVDIDTGEIAEPPARPTKTDENDVTPGQRVYLYAFELHLRSRDDDERAVTREIMIRAREQFVDRR